MTEYFNEVVRKLKELKSYQDKIPFYNLIGSEGDHNTRVIVDKFLEELDINILEDVA